MLAAASWGVQFWPEEVATNGAVDARPYGRAYGRVSVHQVNAAGTRALTTHANGAVTLWDLERGVRVATHPTPSDAKPPRRGSLVLWRVLTAFTADGAEFRIIRHTGSAGVYDAASGDILRTVEMDLRRRSDAFTPDLSRFADVSADGTVNVWDLDECRHVGAYVTKPRGNANATRVWLSPRGHALAVTTGRGFVTVWDLQTERGPWRFGARRGPPPRIVRVADDAATVVALTLDATELWDVATAAVIQTGEGGARRPHPRGRSATTRRDGHSHVVVLSDPKYTWSSAQPRVLRPATIDGDSPVAFDAAGRLTQDFRAPRDDLAVIHWPPVPGSDGRQPADFISADGRVAIIPFHRTGFDVWRLARAADGGASDSMDGAANVDYPRVEQ